MTTERTARAAGRPCLATALVTGIALMIGAAASRADDGEALERGRELYAAGDPAAARRLFETAVRESPQDPAASFELGRCLVDLGDYEEAIERLRAAVEGDSTRSLYHQLLGEAYGLKARRSGTLTKLTLAGKTRREFEQAVELDPDNLDARLNLLEFYVQAPGIVGGGDDKALEQARQIRARDAWMGHRAFATYHRRRDEMDLAVAEYEAATAEAPENAQAHYRLGELFADLAEWDKAEASLAAALSLESELRGALYQKGRVAAYSGRGLDDGRVALERYLLTPKRRGQPTAAQARYLLGLIEERAGDFAAARAAFAAAIKLDPQLDEALAAARRVE